MRVNGVGGKGEVKELSKLYIKNARASMFGKDHHGQKYHITNLSLDLLVWEWLCLLS